MQQSENPKLIQAQKDGKAPLEYLIDSVQAGDAWVHKGGADKYGVRNWLIDKIKATTYIGAIRRHLNAWSEGQDVDPAPGSELSHLYHIRACCAIVLDAEKHGTLIDDRNHCESLDQSAPGIDELQAEMERVTHVCDIPIGQESSCADLRATREMNAQYTPLTKATIESIEPNSHYLVCFTDDIGPGKYIRHKGPFPDLWRAEEYATKNPHNYAGVKTIHTITRP